MHQQKTQVVGTGEMKIRLKKQLHLYFYHNYLLKISTNNECILIRFEE